MKKNQQTKIITANGMEIKAATPVIISASRATDIPAFYAEWFFNRLQEGYCKWRNPFSGQYSYVSFQNTRFIVFWSKNPAPLIPYIEKLKAMRIDCYIQYTLNDYEEDSLEPGLPKLEDRLDTYKLLSKYLGKERIIWRYDPLVLTNDIDIKILLAKLKRIGDCLRGFTDTLVFSFADISNYVKVKRNMQQHKIQYMEWTTDAMLRFSRQLAQLNKERSWNYKLATCAEKIDLSIYGISHNRCIDDELIIKLANSDRFLMDFLDVEFQLIEPNIWGDCEIPPNSIKINDLMYAIRKRSNKAIGQRQLCDCINSKDIGCYDTCPHGCVYCYANRNEIIARTKYLSHNPFSETI